jgi:SAM-dependent methyltransferase
MVGIYAEARQVGELRACYFYQSVELPGLGLVQGEWDLRAGVEAYLGGVELRGKRVLELGTASGFLCFEMERRGAEVVAYDLSAQDEWDIVPYGGRIPVELLKQRQTLIEQINNAWWLSHRLLGSKARVVYGNIYDLPAEIGEVDISTFGSILLHVRDPFLALQRAAALTRETMVVTEALPVFWRSPLMAPLRLLGSMERRIPTYLTPALDFLPDPERGEPWDTWWNFSPALVERFLKILGFGRTRITFHQQPYYYGEGRERMRMRRLFTVVGRR